MSGGCLRVGEVEGGSIVGCQSSTIEIYGEGKRPDD